MFRQKERVMRRLLVVLTVLLLPRLPCPGAAVAAVAGVATDSAAPDAPASEAAGQKLPTVEWVLERYVTATGGREALSRYKSMTIHGRYEVSATGLTVEAVSYTKDGKSLQVVTLPAGKSLSGYDGHTAWGPGFARQGHDPARGCGEERRA